MRVRTAATTCVHRGCVRICPSEIPRQSREQRRALRRTLHCSLIRIARTTCRVAMCEAALNTFAARGADALCVSALSDRTMSLGEARAPLHPATPMIFGDRSMLMQWLEGIGRHDGRTAQAARRPLHGHSAQSRSRRARSSAAYAGRARRTTARQAKRIHDRLAGVPPTDAVLDAMATDVASQATRSLPRTRPWSTGPSTTSRSRTSRCRGPIATRRCSRRSTTTWRPSSAWSATTCRSTGAVGGHPLRRQRSRRARVLAREQRSLCRARARHQPEGRL